MGWSEEGVGVGMGAVAWASLRKYPGGGVWMSARIGLPDVRELPSWWSKRVMKRLDWSGGCAVGKRKVCFVFF